MLTIPHNGMNGILLGLLSIAFICFLADLVLAQTTQFSISDDDVVACAKCSTESPKNCDPHFARKSPQAASNCLGVCSDPGFPAKPAFKKPGDIDRGGCPPKRYQQCDHCRAGCPHELSRWAADTDPTRYTGSYVGGGALFVGRPRTATEGTWGFDYHGLLCPERVVSWWTCGRSQGGEGAYQTDHERRFDVGRL